MKIIVGHSSMYGNKEILVDDEDYEYLNKSHWHIVKGLHVFYAVRHFNLGANKIRKKQLMHRAIMNPSSEFVVDHKDRNGLNNQRSNLRVCTQAENCRNRIPKIKGTSKYLGVYWESTNKKWYARIGLNGKTISIGRFVVEIDAAKAYDIKAKELFGEFSNLNFQ